MREWIKAWESGLKYGRANSKMRERIKILESGLKYGKSGCLSNDTLIAASKMRKKLKSKPTPKPTASPILIQRSKPKLTISKKQINNTHTPLLSTSQIAWYYLCVQQIWYTYINFFYYKPERFVDVRLNGRTHFFPRVCSIFHLRLRKCFSRNNEENSENCVKKHRLSVWLSSC